MTLLEFFFIISWIIILVLAIDIWRKEKFNALHFLLFILMWGWLLAFTLFPWILKWIWDIFWVARWADVLVYWSVVFLLYFVLLLLSKHVENKESLTSLIRELAIENSPKKTIKGFSVIFSNSLLALRLLVSFRWLLIAVCYLFLWVIWKLIYCLQQPFLL